MRRLGPARGSVSVAAARCLPGADTKQTPQPQKQPHIHAPAELQTTNRSLQRPPSNTRLTQRFASCALVHVTAIGANDRGLRLHRSRCSNSARTTSLRHRYSANPSGTALPRRRGQMICSLSAQVEHQAEQPCAEAQGRLARRLGTYADFRYPMRLMYVCMHT